MKKKNVKNKMSTSKILIIFLFMNCTFIELFTCWSIIAMLSIAPNIGSIDFSPLVTLIGTVVGEVISYGIYSAKAAKENTVGGVVFETALASKENNSDNIDE